MGPVGVRARGRAYDFTRPFFEQMKELIQTVPWPSRSFLDNAGSDYCMNCSYLKNCYMLFDADSRKDSSYCVGVNKLKNYRGASERPKLSTARHVTKRNLRERLPCPEHLECPG